MAACSVEELLAKAERDEAEKLKSIAVHKELDLEFDVGNLLACDKNRIESRDFKGQKKEDFLSSVSSGQHAAARQRDLETTHGESRGGDRGQTA
ncbi:Ribosome biogenesis regulatory protein-like protein [Nibea albiflora]|uniref:Ribosome biogenesis regulatory protein-like protein n=1 Tax=Nibea albiflora TaxID=240163 RepID=A0ACB7F5K1_NIBAL|nr:Ribosome biogenesis regulatory protein-like protein [Nibea albiflora]